MNISDFISRTDAILTKYEKYIAEKKEKDHGKGSDPFMDAYSDLLEKINELSLKADDISKEKNRALKASLNAELRRAKALLAENELRKLEKLLKKGKGVTQEIIDDRLSKIAQARDAIESISDGIHSPRRPYKGSAAGGPKGKTISIEIDGHMDHRTEAEGYYTHTEATSKFRQDWEVSKKKQDKALDNIEKGITTLKGIGEAMGEELRHQNILADEIESKMDKVTGDLKNNNMKLKGLLTKMRSSRNFCLDAVLICIILGLAAYLVAMFRR
eukprot:jgi/Botrbrau1/5822/Bobra.0366s0008.1